MARSAVGSPGERKGTSRAPLAAMLGAAGVLVASMLGVAEEQEPAPAVGQVADEHAALFAEDRFPSATTCAPCHADIYREWSVSAHAYAQMSPVFNAMHAKVLKETNGTNGDFCIRCHTPVGMNLREPEFLSNLDRHPTSREGITCIVCHRVDQPYGKISGRLPIVEGSLFEPVFGPNGNEELERAIESGRFNLQTDPERAGRGVHAEAREFVQLSRSGLCGSCHDVNMVNGFRLEEAFSEYKHTPAAAAGSVVRTATWGRNRGCRRATARDRPRGSATARRAPASGRTTCSRGRTTRSCTPASSRTIPRRRRWRRCASGLPSTTRPAGARTRSRTPCRTTTDSPRAGPSPTTATTPPTSSATTWRYSTSWPSSGFRCCRRGTSSATWSSIVRARTASRSASSSATAPTATTFPPASTPSALSG